MEGFNGQPREFFARYFELSRVEYASNRRS